MLFRQTSLTAFLFLLLFSAFAQRTYTGSSVFQSGIWAKVAVKNPGIYRVDVSFLQSLGFNQSTIPSASIRLFGNPAGMLPENNAAPRTDDLTENAILVFDGGDGVFNGSDYFIFYAEGPDRWFKDSLNQRFRHQKNLYSGEAFYFITIGGTGLRIQQKDASGAGNKIVTSFRDRLFYELDSVNMLKSGKQWYGEEFGNLPGRPLTRQFTFNIPGLLSTETAFLQSEVIGRTAGASSTMRINIGSSTVLTHFLPSVGTGQYDQVASSSNTGNSFIPSSSNSISLTYTFQPGGINAQAWLNWFEIFPKRNLSLAGLNQLLFRDWESVGLGNNAEFRITDASANTSVWDVTTPELPIALKPILQGNELRFSAPAERLREYVAFQNQGFLLPEARGAVANQNLHGINKMDYIIVSPPSFIQEARRLANWHQEKQGLRTTVVTTEQVYNEFSSGVPDPTAIRDFVKMLYDRAGSDLTARPRYLLLLGDASYDFRNRIAGNNNLVPCFQSENSLDPLSTYTSDDFFGFLDDNEDVNTSFPLSLLDIGIGRIPARTIQDAKNVVDKIIRYHDKESFGPWRNQITLIADDEDNNLHFDDAEYHATVIKPKEIFQLNKIYLDAYRQQSGSGGSRYPEVNQAINNRILNGTLIWNYSGHGGFRRLAEEVILDQEMVNTWNNSNRLPLFVTATCDFAPYDNPQITSLGENLLLREKTGAIALMTTTRVVFAFSNRVINNMYFQQALTKGADGKYPSLGESIRLTKNATYQNFGDIVNNRKFTLLGDPALRLGFPEYNIKTTSVNNFLPGSDTLRAMDKYEIKGEVVDADGNLLDAFNGDVYPSVYDKEQTLQTFANDPESRQVSFQTQSNLLFQGKARVVNGKFTYSFVVPKDINYQYGQGKILYYADNGLKQGAGAETNWIIGGVGKNPASDAEGPQIKAYINDEKFVNGGITNETPVLFLRLFDSSGINTVGTGIGHDITVTLDDDPNKFFVLNDFYQADENSYQRGGIRFQLPSLSEGLHQIRVKAWDVVNNSSDALLEFRVVKDQDLQLTQVYNYPNPFTSKTTFMFEHNRPGDLLSVSIRVFTASGKLVKNIRKTINNAGNRSFEIEWNGEDDFGEKLARGVYIYRIEVKDSQGKKKTALQKLVIL
jgi:hypothetical protein